MAFPEEAVWKTHHGMKPSSAEGSLVRAGRFVIGPDDIVEWEVRRWGDKFYAVTNYFTWAEAWDNAWMKPFRKEKEAVDFARAQAEIGRRLMQESHQRHGGRADQHEIAEVVNKNRYEPPPPGMSGLGASLGNKDEPVKPFNKIGHISDWDGTLRSYKALYAIQRFNPRNAGDIARIWIEERNSPVDMYQVEFPMFLEVPELEDFVQSNFSNDDLEDRYFNYYITHWDLTDSVHDMWKLSPVLKLNYPGHTQMFNGVNIGAGWHEILASVRKSLDR